MCQFFGPPCKSYRHQWITGTIVEDWYNSLRMTVSSSEERDEIRVDGNWCELMMAKRSSATYIHVQCAVPAAAAAAAVMTASSPQSLSSSSDVATAEHLLGRRLTLFCRYSWLNTAVSATVTSSTSLRCYCCEYCNRTDTGRLPAEWAVADRWCCRSCDRESFSLSSLLLKQRTAMIRTLLAWKDNQVCTCARRPLDEIIGCVARVFNSNVHRGWHFNPVRALKHSSVLP